MVFSDQSHTQYLGHWYHRTFQYTNVIPGNTWLWSSVVSMPGQLLGSVPFLITSGDWLLATTDYTYCLIHVSLQLNSRVDLQYPLCYKWDTAFAEQMTTIARCWRRGRVRRMCIHTIRSVTWPHLAVPLRLAPGAPPRKHGTLLMCWFNVGPAPWPSSTRRPPWWRIIFLLTNPFTNDLGWDLRYKLLLAQYRANVCNIRPPLTQTYSYCESSTLWWKQTFSLWRSHMKKREDKVWWDI